MIGCFTDDAGTPYFMLVNLSHGPGQSAQECELTLHMTFNPYVAAVVRFDRETGEPVDMPLTPVGSRGETEMVVTLPGGTGDLFKFNNGDFAGIENQ